MKNLTQILIFSTFLILSCSNVDRKADKKILNKDFDLYLQEIEFLDFPYETSCNNSYGATKEINKELLLKYTEGDGEKPFKRIPTDKGFEIVLNL